MDYAEALRYIDGFTDLEKKTGYSVAAFDLRRPRELLALLGDPQLRFPSVLVAGTKGKGSTAAMVASIFQASGRRVGLYSQPHLHTFRERIRVDGRLITPEELALAVEAVAPAVERFRASRPELGPPTTYEVATAAALHFFAGQRLDLAVLEVGLGGRLDAANVVDPLVSVLTPISLDHMQLLGNSIAEIAAEKAGIIRDRGVVVASEQTEEAMAVIRRVAEERGARLVVARTDPIPGAFPAAEGEPPSSTSSSSVPVDVRPCRPPSSPPSPAGKGAGGLGHPLERARLRQERTDLTLRGPSGAPYRVRLPLLGSHQLSNAATAIAVVEQLAGRGLRVEREAVERGLAEVRWPGRLEVVCREPLVVVDGAHNGDSARKLAAALRESFVYRNLLLVLGTSADKDVEGIAAALAPEASTVIATRSRHPRAAEPERLAAEARKGCRWVETSPDLASALARATVLAAPADLVCVTGSLFIVASAREHYGLAEEAD